MYPHHFLLNSLCYTNGLSIWKSRPSHPWGSFSKTHTFTETFLCLKESAPADTWPCKNRSLFGKKIPHSWHYSHHKATVLYITFSLTLLQMTCHLLQQPPTEQKLWTSDRGGTIFATCSSTMTMLFPISYSFGGKQDMLSVSPLTPPRPTVCHMTLCDTIQDFLRP